MTPKQRLGTPEQLPLLCKTSTFVILFVIDGKRDNFCGKSEEQVTCEA